MKVSGETGRRDRLDAENRNLRARIAEVVAAHTDMGWGQGYDGEGNYTDFEHTCRVCGTWDEYAVAWPCPTVRALTEETADGLA